MTRFHQLISTVSVIVFAAIAYLLLSASSASAASASLPMHGEPGYSAVVCRIQRPPGMLPGVTYDIRATVAKPANTPPARAVLATSDIASENSYYLRPEATSQTWWLNEVTSVRGWGRNWYRVSVVEYQVGTGAQIRVLAQSPLVSTHYTPNC